MGIDCPNVHHIIHVGPPSDVESYIQQIGRAGRDNEKSYASILYSKRLMENTSERLCNYCTLKEKECRRIFLFNDFDCYVSDAAIKGCECCDLCMKSCLCDRCETS